MITLSAENPICYGFILGLLPTGPTLIKCQDGVMGRYVKIFIEKSEFMTLCEVEITGHKDGPNIALGKPTVQSSTVDMNIYWSSSLAVDGNRNGDAYQSHCSHTGHDDINPWLQVDLGHLYNITSVTIVNRRDDREHVYTRMVDTRILIYESDPITTTTPIRCIITVSFSNYTVLYSKYMIIGCQ
ncbi:hypothetical protein SNE40_012689 [Patella caerulea]|uniref:Fucolectin tachylectin-4 pentraxin-1 domain-containing protein n=1 Tax=Patella caerulea TaxID=87958 RepID=A0AAN8JM81_PATCE